MAELLEKKIVKEEEDDDEEEVEEVVAPKVEEKEEDTSLANSDVTTKYQEAAKIAQSTLLDIIALVFHKNMNSCSSTFLKLIFII